MRESAIREVVDAYRAATYAIRLSGGRRVVLRIGALMPSELRALLDSATTPQDALLPHEAVAIAADPRRAVADAADATTLGANTGLIAAGRITAGLITAWNPFSQATPLRENRARQRELLARLRERAKRVLPASGFDVGWREPGFAAFAIDAEALDDLARTFRQNAIVTFGAGDHVRLRLYRDDWRDALANSDVDLAPPARG